jgi:hypothetical protein
LQWASLETAETIAYLHYYFGDGTTWGLLDQKRKVGHN